MFKERIAQLQELLEVITLCIARKTKNPEIEYIPEKALFTVRVDPHDQGKMIGKKGATIWAIQTMLWHAGMIYLNHTVGVQLLEPVKGADIRATPFRARSKWDRELVTALIDKILSGCFGENYSFILHEETQTCAKYIITLDAYLKMQVSEPSLEDALDRIIRSVGMSQGAYLNTQVIWK